MSPAKTSVTSLNILANNDSPPTRGQMSTLTQCLRRLTDKKPRTLVSGGFSKHVPRQECEIKNILGSFCMEICIRRGLKEDVHLSLSILPILQSVDKYFEPQSSFQRAPGVEYNGFNWEIHTLCHKRDHSLTRKGCLILMRMTVLLTIREQRPDPWKGGPVSEKWVLEAMGDLRGWGR